MSTHRGHRRLTAFAATVALGAAAVVPSSAAVGGTTGVTTHAVTTTSSCGVVWGSLARSNGTAHTTGTLDGVRAGRHTCFDRLVLDVDDVPGSLTYDVRYVDTVRADGSGMAVPLAGGADLQVVLRAAAYDDRGRSTYPVADPTELVDVDGWSTFRQVAWAGSFEGQTTVGLGVRARLPFRVLVLDGPGDGARLVVDVAHRW
jgi:hypothetical protein